MAQKMRLKRVTFLFSQLSKTKDAGTHISLKVIFIAEIL